MEFRMSQEVFLSIFPTHFGSIVIFTVLRFKSPEKSTTSNKNKIKLSTVIHQLVTYYYYMEIQRYTTVWTYTQDH